MSVAKIGFVGLGVMGEPICRNMLLESGKQFFVFDLNAQAVERLVASGARKADSVGELAAEVDALDTAYDAQSEELTEIRIRPKSTDIHIPLIGLAWMPYRDGGDGRLISAWDS